MKRKKLTVVYSDEALEDLDDIYAYIAESLHEKGTAANLIKRIQKELCGLEPFSEMFQVVEWEPWHSDGVRKMLVGNYSVYYRSDMDTSSVRVLRIFYGGRDVESIVSEDRE